MFWIIFWIAYLVASKLMTGGWFARGKQFFKVALVALVATFALYFLLGMFLSA